METFFNKVKASVRSPEKDGHYHVIHFEDEGQGKEDALYFEDKTWRTIMRYGSIESHPPEYWLEELPVLSSIMFTTPQCRSLEEFTLDVNSGDRYASSSIIALRAYAYTIKDYDSRLSKALYMCVDRKDLKIRKSG